MQICSAKLPPLPFIVEGRNRRKEGKEKRGLQLISDISYISIHKYLQAYIFCRSGCFFNWCSPISVPKRKPAKQPITAFLSIRIYRNSTSDWLAGSFLFGTEIGEHQLKKHPVYQRRSCFHTFLRTSFDI